MASNLHEKLNDAMHGIYDNAEVIKHVIDAGSSLDAQQRHQIRMNAEDILKKLEVYSLLLTPGKKEHGRLD